MNQAVISPRRMNIPKTVISFPSVGIAWKNIFRLSKFVHQYKSENRQSLVARQKIVLGENNLFLSRFVLYTTKTNSKLFLSN